MALRRRKQDKLAKTLKRPRSVTVLSRDDELFKFELLRQGADASADELERIETRIGVLLASQVAIAVLLVDKVSEIGWPDLLALLVASALTAWQYRIRKERRVNIIAIADDLARDPAITRRKASEDFKASIRSNEAAAKIRARWYTGLLVATLLIVFAPGFEKLL